MDRAKFLVSMFSKFLTSAFMLGCSAYLMSIMITRMMKGDFEKNYEIAFVCGLAAAFGFIWLGFFFKSLLKMMDEEKQPGGAGTKRGA